MILQAYNTYLKSEHYKARTINEHIKNTKMFLNWLQAPNQLEVEQVQTAKILDYVKHLQDNSLATSTINIRLGSIRRYFDYLISEQHITRNPANKIHIKGAVKKVIIDPLDYSELELLYKTYSDYRTEVDKDIRSKTASLRRKVILGFMVFQGIHTGELKRLETHHVKDEQGTIYIVGSGRIKARELKLNPVQMRTLFTYLSNMPDKQTHLFVRNLNNQISYLVEELRGLNEKVQDSRHIRSSVILHWLKLNGKRQVQYMIGHKWISSTEYYEQQDLETLTNQLDIFHPFRWVL